MQYDTHSSVWVFPQTSANTGYNFPSPRMNFFSWSHQARSSTCWPGDTLCNLCSQMLIAEVSFPACWDCTQNLETENILLIAFGLTNLSRNRKMSKSLFISEFSQGSSIKGNIAQWKIKSTLVTMESVANDHKSRFLAVVLQLVQHRPFPHGPRLPSSPSWEALAITYGHSWTALGRGRLSLPVSSLTESHKM